MDINEPIEVALRVPVTAYPALIPSPVPEVSMMVTFGLPGSQFPSVPGPLMNIGAAAAFPTATVTSAIAQNTKRFTITTGFIFDFLHGCQSGQSLLAQGRA